MQWKLRSILNYYYTCIPFRFRAETFSLIFGFFAGGLSSVDDSSLSESELESELETELLELFSVDDDENDCVVVIYIYISLYDF